MAKRDILIRFSQTEQEYKEMLSLIKELEEDVKNNKIPQEYYESKVELITNEIEAIKLQYFFWAEAIFELNKPNRKDKKLNDFELKLYAELESKTKECLKDNSQDALKTIKEVIEKGKV